MSGINVNIAGHNLFTAMILCCKVKKGSWWHTTAEWCDCIITWRDQFAGVHDWDGHWLLQYCYYVTSGKRQGAVRTAGHGAPGEKGGKGGYYIYCDQGCHTHSYIQLGVPKRGGPGGGVMGWKCGGSGVGWVGVRCISHCCFPTLEL